MIEFNLYQGDDRSPKPILIQISSIRYVYPDGKGTWIAYSSKEGDGIAVKEDYQQVKARIQRFLQQGY